MLIKLSAPVTIDGLAHVRGQIIAAAPSVAMRLIAGGSASLRSLPQSVEPDTDEALEERKQRARDQGQNPDWWLDPRHPRHEQPKASADKSFGHLLTQAVKARLRSRSRHTAVTAASGEAESFADKLRNAVKKKLGQRARTVS